MSDLKLVSYFPVADGIQHSHYVLAVLIKPGTPILLKEANGHWYEGIYQERYWPCSKEESPNAGLQAGILYDDGAHHGIWEPILSHREVMLRE